MPQDFAESVAKEMEQNLATIKQQMKQDALQRQAVESQVLLTNRPPMHAASTDERATMDDMQKAVADVYDMQERVGFTFMILGGLAKSIKEKQSDYQGEKIELGMPVKYLTPEVRSLFKTWNFQETEYGYQYFFTPPTRWGVKIPVEIHVYKKHWPFFDNPDFGFYGTEMLHIPNPFEKYWKVRNLVK